MKLEYYYQRNTILSVCFAEIHQGLHLGIIAFDFVARHNNNNKNVCHGRVYVDVIKYSVFFCVIIYFIQPQETFNESNELKSLRFNSFYAEFEMYVYMVYVWLHVVYIHILREKELSIEGEKEKKKYWMTLVWNSFMG